VVDCVKIVLTSSLITTQVGMLFLILCANVGDPKLWDAAWGPHPWDQGVTDAIETRPYPICLTIPNFVALGETILAYWVPKIVTFVHCFKRC